MPERKKTDIKVQLTKAQIRGKNALAAARDRGLPKDVAKSAAHAGVRERPFESFDRLRRARKIAELTGRGTSIARVRRHGSEQSDEEILEEIERLEREIMEKRDAIAKLGLAPPLPRSVLRPKPKKK